MSNDKSLKPAIAELENMYQFLANTLLEPTFKYDRDRQVVNGRQGTPTNPVILLQQQGRRKSLTWYAPKSWESVTATAVAAIAGKQAQRPKFAEISVATELLSKPMETIFDELLVVSYAHWYYFYRYFSGAEGQYFTRNLQSWLSGFGLQTQKTGGLGYREVTSRSDRLTKTYQTYTMKDPFAFRLVRDHNEGTRKTGSPLKKWKCSCTIVRATARTINLRCADCGEYLVYSDHDAFEFHERIAHEFLPDDTGNTCRACNKPQTNGIHFDKISTRLYKKGK